MMSERQQGQVRCALRATVFTIKPPHCIRWHLRTTESTEVKRVRYFSGHGGSSLSSQPLRS